MSTSVSAPSNTSTAASRATGRLYLVRAVIAVIWAGLFAAALSSTGALTAHSDLPGFAVALLVLYPVIDIVASLLDVRTQQAAGNPSAVKAQLVNAAISTVAAVGLAVAAADGPASVLRVFGTWAVLTGLIQLALAITRRRRGTAGQWPMILSGAQSALIGASFVLAATKTEIPLGNLNGYPVGGALYYLFSAFRLYRTARPEADHG
jgi:uncharacterized membrane protein HdeD (DUF308 family)